MHLTPQLHSVFLLQMVFAAAVSNLSQGLLEIIPFPEYGIFWKTILLHPKMNNQDGPKRTRSKLT